MKYDWPNQQLKTTIDFFSRFEDLNCYVSNYCILRDAAIFTLNMSTLLVQRPYLSWWCFWLRLSRDRCIGAAQLKTKKKLLLRRYLPSLVSSMSLDSFNKIWPKLLWIVWPTSCFGWIFGNTISSKEVLSALMSTSRTSKPREEKSCKTLQIHSTPLISSSGSNQFPSLQTLQQKRGGL